jgi:DNA mismatch repair protein MutL
MADIIQLLPDNVANQIAAGEVVQRPASAVKELIENAIDAKATQIQLIIKDAGKTLIQVVDNGIGMSSTDARLCFERHATSKIKNAQDLFNLSTKGFRGEALASIAAIAQVELRSKQEHQEIGTKIIIKGNKVTEQEPISINKGTTILVKNLFYNIPARRNFLKSDSVELRHIIDEFHRVVLAHQAISFSLHHNGSELFQLETSNLRQRIVSVFGSKINEKLVPIEEATELVKINGFVGKPNFAKKKRGEQFFFVNNRFIKNSYLHHAIMSAYEGLLQPKAIPSYFLFLEVDPKTIDINIHPTKTEIKFEDEHSIYAILRAAVKHSLGQYSVVPSLDFDKDPSLDLPYEYSNKPISSPTITVDRNFNPFDDKPKANSPSKSSFTPQFQKKPMENWDALYNPTQASIFFEQDAKQEALFEEETSAKTFQINKKYIVSPFQSGLLIIHQNRAHQRILFERFLQLKHQNTAIQQLLFPQEIHFSKPEIALLKLVITDLEDLGFQFTIQDEILLITGVPSFLETENINKLIQDLLESMQEDAPSKTSISEQIIAKSMAKSLALKTGDVLNSKAQENLINELFSCSEPSFSPDGKAIIHKESLNKIDTKFN